ncbi:MAG: HPr family phosphocarrier protein [Parvularculaceae bacterium]
MAALSQKVTIRNARGLHARASAKFAAVAGSYDAEITVACCEWRVSALSIMGLLMLGAGVGEEIEITAEGPQAQEAIDTLVRLIEDRFGEKE